MKIGDLLNDGEKIERSTKAHLAPFFVPLCIALILAIIGIVLLIIDSMSSVVYGVIVFIVAGLILIYGLTRLEYLLTTKIFVTDRRVILKSGIINSVTSELPLDKLSGITVVEPLLGKLFHYGTIIIESSASTVGIRAMYIDKPYDFKKAMKIEGK